MQVSRCTGADALEQVQSRRYNAAIVCMCVYRHVCRRLNVYKLQT